MLCVELFCFSMAVTFRIGGGKLRGNKSRSMNRTSDVGRLHWFGRIIGNQYRGSDRARKVDLLRGSNCLFSGQLPKERPIGRTSPRARCSGHWELVLALRARQQAKRLFYDPEIEVIHHVAPRLDADQIHRGRFSYDATVDLAFNETFVILKYVSGLFRLTALLWQLLVGSPQCPGFAILVRSAIASKPIGLPKIRATLRAAIGVACKFKVAAGQGG
jgi:hypothetical protein